jgi:predicted metalloendopeptidase
MGPPTSASIDFHQYACGSWPNSLGQDHSEQAMIDVIQVNDDKIDLPIQHMVERGQFPREFPYQTESDHKMLMKLHATFTQCHQYVPSPQDADDLIVHVLKAFDEGMRINVKQAFSQGLLAAILQGATPFITLKLASNHPNHSPRHLWMVQPILPFEVPVTEAAISTLREHLLRIRDIDSQFLNRKVFWWRNPLNELVNHFSNLDNLRPPFNNQLQSMFDIFKETSLPISVQELQSTLDFLDWSSFFDALDRTVAPLPPLAFPSKSNAHQAFSKVRQVILNNYRHLHQLSTVIKLMDPDLMRITLALAVLYPATRHLNYFRSSPSNSNLRRQFCQELNQSRFSIIYARWTTQSKITKQDETKLQSMFHDLKETFDRHLSSVPKWDPETRARARDKLKSMRLQVGLPKPLHKASAIDAIYSALHPLQSQMQLFRAAQMHLVRLKVITQQQPDLNVGCFTQSIYQSSQAAYCITSNLIIMSPHMLVAGYPMYQAGLPDSILYGSLGTILSHEIAHGLFFPGLWMNGDGIASHWWSERSRIGFQQVLIEIAQAYDSQSYSISPSQSRSVNGWETKEENLADMVGLKIAFRAWEKNHRQSPSQLIPGFPPAFNAAHQFFLSFAQGYCNKMTHSGYQLQLHQHVGHMYPPFHARVVVPLRNSLEFASVFQCNPGLGHTMCTKNKVVELI